jgi:hypothetical protein
MMNSAKRFPWQAVQSRFSCKEVSLSIARLTMALAGVLRMTTALAFALADANTVSLNGQPRRNMAALPACAGINNGKR